MAKHTVITMPGDGIGNQVLPESLRMLKAVGFDAEYIHADIGWDCWREQGNALPDRTIELLTKHKLGLFGAITSKPNKAAQAELNPELQGKGLCLLLADCDHAADIQSRYLHAAVRRVHGQSAELHPQESGHGCDEPGFDEPKIDTTVFARAQRACTREWSGRILPESCVPR
jgi:hypothetical protein